MRSSDMTPSQNNSSQSVRFKCDRFNKNDLSAEWFKLMTDFFLHKTRLFATVSLKDREVLE